jgi:hypothetical protein
MKPTISSLTEQMISEFDEKVYSVLLHIEQKLLNRKEGRELIVKYVKTHFRKAAEQLLDSVREEDIKLTKAMDSHSFSSGITHGYNSRNLRLESAIEEAKK